MANLKDIAALTGLSTNTVSRALRDMGYVSADARKRIRQAADELGYSPNRAARSLRFNVNFEVLVLVYLSRNNSKGDPLTMDKLIGIREALADSSYGLNLQFLYTRPNMDELLRQKPVGVIIIGDGSEQMIMAGECGSRQLPVVLISYSALKDYDCVYIDRAQGVADSINYLYSLGKRHIVYAGNLRCPNRLGGYRRAIADLGLKENIVEINHGFRNIESIYDVGREAVNEILKQTPETDAIQTYSDYLAAGISAGLAEAGRKIPQDIAVVGFDNRELAGFVTPPLTTLEQPGFFAGKYAAELLLRKLDVNKEQTIEAVKVPMKLIIRKST